MAPAKLDHLDFFLQVYSFLIGQSEKSEIEIESEYQLTGHPVFDELYNHSNLPDFLLSTKM